MGARVLIVGGGVAGLEALMALRDLAGDRIAITLVAPEDDFVYRPMTVAEPFGHGVANRYPLRAVAEDFDARLVRAAVAAIDGAERRALLRGGDELEYDTLVLAPGARALPPFAGAITVGSRGANAALRALAKRVGAGEARRVAFVAPSRAGWLLPLYELALMTAAVARRGGGEVVIVTPEEAPLDLFGAGASAEVARLLAAAGVEHVGATVADADEGRVSLGHGRTLEVDGVVALPLIRGPEIAGVPGVGRYGFIPVDAHGRVAGLRDAYAAGDAIEFPLKQGGLATQQADAAAEHIAARHGAPIDPAPLRPVLRGLLLAGDERRFMRGGEATPEPLWWPPTKIAGRYLGPYLRARDEGAVADPPRGFADVEVELGAPG